MEMERSVTKPIGRPPKTQKPMKVHFFTLPCKPGTSYPLKTFNRHRVTCSSCKRELKRVVQ